MPTRGTPMLLLVCLLLAGCSFPLRESSSGPEGVDAGDYGGGTGLAVHLVNRAPTESFNVTLLVRASDGGEAARLQVHLAPAQELEKWWSLDPGVYRIDMDYQVREGARSSSGGDEKSVEVGGECSELARIGWRFVRLNETVGSAYLGRTCVSSEDSA